MEGDPEVEEQEGRTQEEGDITRRLDVMAISGAH